MPTVPQLISDLLDVQLHKEDKDKFTLFDDVEKVIAKIANYAQVVTDIIPAGAAVISLLKDAFFPGGGPSDREVLDSIAEKLDALIRFQHGFQEHLDMLDIDKIVGKSSDRLETLFRVGTPDSPDVNRTETLQDTLDAANFLGNRDFWTRPFFDEMVYPRGDLSGANAAHVFWFGETRQSLKPPVDPDTGFVFDPRLAFPAYMKAIENRNCVLPMFHPGDFQAVFAKEFSNPTPDLITGPGRVEVLTDRYNEMLGGLLTARIPTPEEILTVFDQRPVSVDIISTWLGTFGVVDVFNGSALLEIYPVVDDERFFDPNWKFNLIVIQATTPNNVSDGLVAFLFSNVQRIRDNYPILQARLTLGGLARKKALYVARGLHHAWEVIQKLKRLAGRSDIEEVDREAVWSLREINAILPPVPVEPGEFPDPTQRVRLTIGQLAIHLANLPTVEGLSLRSALDKATP
jgi:hypothetical protein